MHDARRARIRGLLQRSLWLSVFTLVVLASGTASPKLGTAFAEEPHPLPFPQPDTWVAGETSVSKLSDEQKRQLCGLSLEMLAQERAKARAAAPPALVSYDYPPAADWRNWDGRDWTTPIRDQGGCGSCVAFGTIGAIESRLKIAAGDADLNPDLSEAFLFYCGCGRCCSFGWQFSAAMEFALNWGIIDETCYPYVAGNQECTPCAGWQDRVTKIVAYDYLWGAEETKQAIAVLGPVQAAMLVYGDFFYYRSGIYHHVWGDAKGGHSVSLVGYNDEEGYWIAKNSWGTGWGEEGWFRIAYGDSGIGGHTAPIVACTDPLEPNDNSEQASALQIGVSYTADLCPAGDEDYYAFAGSAGDRLVLDVDADSLGSGLNSSLSLYDSDGQTMLAHNDDHDGYDPWIQHALPADGTYYVVVRAQGPTQVGRGLRYRLTARLVPDIGISPMSVAVVVPLGQVGNVALALSNTGSGSLDFEISAADRGLVPGGCQAADPLRDAESDLVVGRGQPRAKPTVPHHAASQVPSAFAGADLADGAGRTVIEPVRPAVGAQQVPWLLASPSAGQVGPGGALTVDLTLDATVPEVLKPGEYSASLLIHSNDPDTPDLSVPVTMTVAPPFCLTLTPTADAQTGLPGGTVHYNLHLTNTGTLTDTFDVGIRGHSWPTSAPGPIGPLAAAKGAALGVTVRIPARATGGASDTATVTITSLGDDQLSASVTLTTTVPVIHRPALTPAAAKLSGLQGALVTYTFHLTNTGTVSDTFEVSIHGHSWPTLAPSPIGPLAPGQGRKLPVTVRIPTRAAAGAADTATLTVTSLGDTKQSAGTSLTTTARSLEIHLPLVLKGAAGP